MKRACGAIPCQHVRKLSEQRSCDEVPNMKIIMFNFQTWFEYPGGSI